MRERVAKKILRSGLKYTPDQHKKATRTLFKKCIKLARGIKLAMREEE